MRLLSHISRCFSVARSWPMYISASFSMPASAQQHTTLQTCAKSGKKAGVQRLTHSRVRRILGLTVEARDQVVRAVHRLPGQVKEERPRSDRMLLGDLHGTLAVQVRGVRRDISAQPRILGMMLRVWDLARSCGTYSGPSLCQRSLEV